MKSLVLVAASVIAMSAIAIFVLQRADSPTVPIESVRKDLPGTTLSLAIPVGWDDTDHSSCRQPCVRLRLLGQSSWPEITFERLAAAGSLSPEQYVEELPLATLSSGPQRKTLGAYSAIEFTLAGDMVSHGPADYARGTATWRSMESQHLIFVAERHLYECTLATYAGDLAKYSEAFRFLCASVAPAGQ